MPAPDLLFSLYGILSPFKNLMSAALRLFFQKKVSQKHMFINQILQDSSSFRKGPCFNLVIKLAGSEVEFPGSQCCFFHSLAVRPSTSRETSLTLGFLILKMEAAIVAPS